MNDEVEDENGSQKVVSLQTNKDYVRRTEFSHTQTVSSLHIVRTKERTIFRIRLTRRKRKLREPQMSWLLHFTRETYRTMLF